MSEARENPFFPMPGEEELIYSSNKNQSLPPLKRTTISLPTTARVLESVTLNYKNLDGSVDSKILKINNSIDWHLPIFISQSYTPSSELEKKPQVKKKEFKYIASIKYAKFYTFEKTLKILTKDKLIRNFLLVKPHRLVLDFEKDTHLKSYIKNNPENIFTKIRVGNHDGYYRVVVELDGYYQYSLKTIDNGYEFYLQ